MTGILGAMAEELEHLLADLQGKTRVQSGKYTLYRGTLAGQAVIIAKCGIGKVGAAALTQLLILEGAQRIIFTGVAGGLEPGLGVGDIVISRDALQHDVDVRALGYELGEIPGEPLRWRADEALVAVAREAANTLPDVRSGGVRVKVGRVLSGDQFIADHARVQALYKTFGGSCAEMEGAAVAQVCAGAGVPFVIIRSLSDSADGGAEIDFRTFTPLAAARAKSVVMAMLARL